MRKYAVHLITPSCSKSVLKILLCAFMICLVNTGQAQEQGIRLSSFKTWNDVLALSQKENKLIFVETYTANCGYCQYMLKEVFTQPAVGRYFNDNFINVTIDIEKGEGIELAKKYAIRAVPTLLFFDGAGRLVYRTVGAVGGPALIAHGKAALAPYLEEVD